MDNEDTLYLMRAYADYCTESGCSLEIQDLPAWLFMMIRARARRMQMIDIVCQSSGEIVSG